MIFVLFQLDTKGHKVISELSTQGISECHMHSTKSRGSDCLPGAVSLPVSLLGDRWTMDPGRSIHQPGRVL